VQLFVLGFLLALQDQLVTTVSEVCSASIYMFNQSKKNVLGLVDLKMEISSTFTSRSSITFHKTNVRTSNLTLSRITFTSSVV